MVIARKVPLPPAPPASRTTSSQPLARASKGKATMTVASAPDSSAPVGNGESNNPSNTGSRAHSTSKAIPESKALPNRNTKTTRSKPKKKHDTKKRRHRGFLSSVAFALLVFLSLYSFSICITERGTHDALCRGVAAYRILVIDPLITRPVRVALAHPSVAPYIARVEPHVNNAIGIVKPVVLHARAQWNAHVLPQWNKHVLPQWNRHALPQIRRIEVALEPYRVYVAREYSKHVTPRIRVVAIYLRMWQHNSQPYIILAASKCRQSYQSMKPYATPIWRRVESGLMQVLAVVQAQSRQFVDPHVARIWEKVKELSSGKPKGPSSVPPSKSSATPQFTSTIESVESSVESTTPSSVSQTSTELPVTSATSVPPISESASSTSTTDSVVQSASTDTSDVSVAVTETVEASSISETLESASSVASASVHETASSVPPILSSEIDSSHTAEGTPLPTQRQGDNEIDLDLDAFLADLGLDDDPTKGASSTSVKTAPQQNSETEEEKAERLRRMKEETAAQRADITKRHTNWEVQLDTRIKAARKDLRKELVAIRKAALAELKESTKIKGQVESFVAEAEKYLKGVEMSLKNLQKDNQKNEDKIALWTRVVTKVSEKFEAKTRETEAVVNEWYISILGKEMQILQIAIASVRALAEQAQADLGMEYAWLDDVTYLDWQRYHELLQRSDDFNNQASSIQNGSDPSPPINPVIPALADLQTELQDIAVGFDTRLRRIKRNGERAFGAAVADDDGNNNDSEFSILPVPDKEHASGDAGQDVPPVILSRSKEQIVEALKNAEAQGVKVVPSEEGDGRVEDKSRESVAEADNSPAPIPVAAPDHVEL